MNDTETPGLDQLIYDLVKANQPMGASTKDQIVEAVKSAIGEDTSDSSIDGMIQRLQAEGMLLPSGFQCWVHFEFDPNVAGL